MSITAVAIDSPASNGRWRERARTATTRKKLKGASIRTNHVYVMKNELTATIMAPTNPPIGPRRSRPITYTTTTVPRPRSRLTERTSTTVGPPRAVIAATR